MDLGICTTGSLTEAYGDTLNEKGLRGEKTEEEEETHGKNHS